MKAPLEGKHILMVLDGFYPPDLRIAKECSALLLSGARVSLACYRSPQQPQTEWVDGVNVIRTRTVVTQKKHATADVINSITGRNQLVNEALSLCRDSYDAVHVHDIPAWNSTHSFARKRALPLVLDLHENYAEGIKTWFSWRSNPVVKLKNKLFFNPAKWEKREAMAVLQSDRIITVVEEMKERIVLSHAVEAQRVHVIRNSEPAHLFDQEAEHDMPIHPTELVYVGGIGPHRGLDTAVQAMPLLRGTTPQVVLVIVGSGNAETVNHLKALCAKEGVEDLVRFTGQLPGHEARARMRGALLNIIPHHSNGQNESGLPHKLFQIMLSKYPMMVSSCRPLQRIIGDNDAGIVFRAGDPIHFAEKVKWAIENPEACRAFAEKAYHMAKYEGYNWETDARELVNLYSLLLRTEN